MNYRQQVLLVLMCTLFCRISAVTELTFRVGDPTPSSCVESSENTVAVCLNQEVTFTCITSGTNFLRWRTSATGAVTNVLFDNNSPNLTQTPLASPMVGILFVAVLQSREGDVFTSTLSAIVDSNAYDGINIMCDDLLGSVATLPLQLINTPPSPPLNLTVSQANCSTNGVCGNASALLMWDCPANTGGTNVTSFNVSLNSNVNGITEYYIVGPTDLSMTIDGLLLNANYTATVTASNCNGTSEASSIIIFNSTALLPPTSVTICSVDSSSIQIRWENPPGNEGLFSPVRQTRIRWTVDDGTSSSVVASPTNTSYDIPNAVQNVTYSVTVTYETADGCEASSDISVVNDESLMDCPITQPTTTATIPGIITRVDVVSISTTSAVVNITYNENIIIGSDSDFNVAVNINPGDITVFQALSPPEQSIHLNGLQPNTEYRGTVHVVNSTGVTVDSIPIIFTTTSVPNGGSSVGAIAGGIVGGVFALGVIVGALLGVCWCYKIKKGKEVRKTKEPPGPVYAEIQPETTDAHPEMKMNVAYGPVEAPVTEKFEMGDNLAYESWTVGH